MVRRLALAAGSPPPSRAATSTWRINLAKTFARALSLAPLRCLVVAHLEWPDMIPPAPWGVDDSTGSAMRDRRPAPSGDAWSPGAHGLDRAQRVAQLAQPVRLVATDQLDAPRQRLRAAARDARVDQGVEHAALAQAQASHDRDAQVGEEGRHAVTADAPRHLAPVELLGRVGQGHALGAAGLAEGVDLDARGQLADDQDLVAVR